MAEPGFIKLMRSEEAEFLTAYPNANHLFFVMAQRARRTDHPLNGLKAGQCFLGDYAEIGLTRQQYRTAQKQLSIWGLAEFTATNKGTIGTINNTKVYDLNLFDVNQQDNQQDFEETHCDSDSYDGFGGSANQQDNQPPNHQLTSTIEKSDDFSIEEMEASNQQDNQQENEINPLDSSVCDLFGVDANQQANQQANQPVTNDPTIKQPLTKNVKNKDHLDLNGSRKSEEKKYCNEFEFLWKERPRREGADPKWSAYKKCKARIKQGATWRELVEGLRRYALYCKIKGKLNTEFVMRMTTFFGNDEYYKNQWTVNSGTQTTPANQVSPSEEFRQHLLSKGKEVNF
ncbi:hypothetical protein ABKY54_004156 [Vibrio harveyi]